MTARPLPMLCLATAVVVDLLFAAISENACPASLQERFTNPPAAAKPFIYWYWRSGYVSDKGIAADIEAFKNAGVGAVYILNVDRFPKPGPAPPYSKELNRRLRSSTVSGYHYS